jgi:hypothetical protein
VVGGEEAHFFVGGGADERGVLGLDEGGEVGVVAVGGGEDGAAGLDVAFGLEMWASVNLGSPLPVMMRMGQVLTSLPESAAIGMVRQLSLRA